VRRFFQGLFKPFPADPPGPVSSPPFSGPRHPGPVSPVHRFFPTRRTTPPPPFLAVIWTNGSLYPTGTLMSVPLGQSSKGPPSFYPPPLRHPPKPKPPQHFPPPPRHEPTNQKPQQIPRAYPPHFPEITISNNFLRFFFLGTIVEASPPPWAFVPPFFFPVPS